MVYQIKHEAFMKPTANAKSTTKQEKHMYEIRAEERTEP
jgi:hypothetical protein